MATSKKNHTSSSMTPQTSSDRISQLFDDISKATVPNFKADPPKRGLDGEVAAIFRQAHSHRNKLINFYIGYTVGFSIGVAILVTFQVHTRLEPHRSNLEIVPQWVLYLLVVGMFGQFIGLLTIVTRKVWTFDPFFKHAVDTSKVQDS